MQKKEEVSPMKKTISLILALFLLLSLCACGSAPSDSAKAADSAYATDAGDAANCNRIWHQWHTTCHHRRDSRIVHCPGRHLL
jgi:predicted small lipoprotein YifL